MRQNRKSVYKLLLPVVTLIVATIGCGGGGGDSGGSGNSGGGETESHTISSIGSVTVGGGASDWVTVSGSSARVSGALTQGGGHINEIVFDSDRPVTIDGIRSGGTVFYDVDRGTDAVSWSASLPFPFWRYYVGGFAVPDYSLGALIPMLSSVQGNFPSGDYQFKIYNPNGETASINIFEVQKVDGNFGSGTLDINLFIYLSGEANPVIPDEASAGAIKTYMNNIFSQVGVSIGNMSVTFRDDPGAIAQMDSEAGMENFLRSASRATAGRGDVGINCFLLPRLPSNILGVDGAIPGPGFLHGVASSGIIAQIAPYGFSSGGLSPHDTDQRVLAKILAHEIGHYLGLFHTSESSGSFHDPLGDTSECTEANDGDGDGKVVGTECGGRGASNLMFWAADPDIIESGDLQENLTSDQGRVANTHPSVL